MDDPGEKCRPEGGLGRRSQVTMRDVARAAGVSTATVSFVLNGHKKVGPGVAQAVLDAARRLSYRPNRAARTLRTGQADVIGCVLPTLASPVFPEIAHAVQARAEALGFATFLVDAGTDRAREEAALAMLADHGVAGAVAVLAPGRSGPLPFPVVLLDAESAGHDTVLADHREGGILQAHHALALGHRQIALLSGAEPYASSLLRREGALAGLAEQHIVPVWEERVPLTSDLPEAARRALKERQFTCLLCVNDLVAMAALSHLRAIGVAVPGAVSVIGFDDVAMAAWPLVGLTTVRQPLVELGARAVDKLSERLADPRRPIATLRLPVTLMSRSTTGPAPAAA